MRFAHIDAEKTRYPVQMMCRSLKVSTSGFYEWRDRDPSERAQRDELLGVKIKAAHKRSRGTYGSPRLRVELAAEGERVSKKRVARLMKQQGLAGSRPRRFRVTTDSNHEHTVAPNLLKRDFSPAAQNMAWVGDITYVWTWQGWLYLAVLIDLWSRRVVGWAVADHMREDLVLDALKMAVGQHDAEGALHHTDRGSQYAGGAYQKELKANGLVCSMSRKGDCWDNAVAESFFSTLKTELLYRQPWPTKRGARFAIQEYITSFYNYDRRHSFLGYMSPAGFEQQFDTDTDLVD